MENNFGLKELYDLTLKATYPIELGNRTFEEGEVIARFDKIQLANFNEVTTRVAAKGGYYNSPRVYWEDTKEIRLNFYQGVFSKRQFALLNNAQLLTSEDSTLLVPMHETLESNSLGKIQLKKENVSEVFVYDAKTYEKIPFRIEDSVKGVLVIGKPYQDVEVDYNFNYQNNISILQIGQRLTKGTLSLEGKTRVKDEITGKVRTAILRIPRVKLVSDLSMRLGREASPIVANLNAVGLPNGDNREEAIMELLFLDDDIDADI